MRKVFPYIHHSGGAPLTAGHSASSNPVQFHLVCHSEIRHATNLVLYRSSQGLNVFAGQCIYVLSSFSLGKQMFGGKSLKDPANGLPCRYNTSSS